MDYLELRSPGGLSTMSGVTGASGLMSPRTGVTGARSSPCGGGGGARPSPKARVRGRAATPSGRYAANGSLTSPSRPSSAPKVRSHSSTGKAAGTTGVMTYVRDMLSSMRPDGALDRPHTYDGGGPEGQAGPALINHGASVRSSAQIRDSTQEILAARMAEIRARSSDHVHSGARAGAGAGALLEPDDDVMSPSSGRRSAGGNSLYGDATGDILNDSRDVTIDVGSLM